MCIFCSLNWDNGYTEFSICSVLLDVGDGNKKERRGYEKRLRSNCGTVDHVIFLEPEVSVRKQAQGPLGEGSPYWVTFNGLIFLRDRKVYLLSLLCIKCYRSIPNFL